MIATGRLGFTKILELHRIAVHKIRREPLWFPCVKETLDPWCQQQDAAARPGLAA